MKKTKILQMSKQATEAVPDKETDANDFNFLDQLFYLKKEGWDKWAKKDALAMKDQGKSPEDIQQKFEDYNDILKKIAEIKVLLPTDKQSTVLDLIWTELDKVTHGQGHENKVEFIEKVDSLLHSWLETKNLTKFITFEKEVTDPVMKQVLKTLNEKEQVEFNNLYKKVFTPEFWKMTTKISPVDAIHFTSTFNFLTEDDFLTNFTLDSLKTFPDLLRSSIISDAHVALKEYFSTDETRKLLRILKDVPVNKPADMLAALNNIHEKKDKNRTEAKSGMARAKKFLLERNPRAASAEITEVEKKFGKNITGDLGEQRFITSLNVTLAQIDYLEVKIKTANDPNQRASLLAKLRNIDSGESNFSHFKNLSQEEKKAKVEGIVNEINQYRQHGDLRSAKSAAKRLRSLDSGRGNDEINKINEAMKNLADSDTEKDTGSKTGQNLEVSGEKKKKIEFYERSIEHAQKVKEACIKLSIPVDDPDYWGREGIKNRVTWLKDSDNGLWEKYKKFNADDKNMPSSAQGNGFRFRWMDNRGSELTGYRAEDGIKYMNRYKESGYTLAALGAAFSVNWKSSDSPTYTPDEFITLTFAQMNELKGTGVK